MTPLRLLTVGSLPPEWGGPVHGGVAMCHASLLAGFLARGTEVEVVGVLPPGPLDRDVPVPVFTRPEGKGLAGFYEELLERLRPDAVLMNHIANTVGVTHARLGSPVPAVGLVHSWHNVTFKRDEERDRALAVTEEAMGGLAAMVVPSRHTLAEGIGLGFRYPAISEAIHNPLQPLYSRGGFAVPTHERRDVLYLGSLVPRKDPLALTEAMALLPGLGLVLAGEGELQEALDSLIGRLALGDRVRIAHLDDREVRERLLRSEVMCLPSRSETFGLAYAEALACGTPVVGFGPIVREIRDEMGIEIGEPLESHTPAEIVAAIERVLDVDWDRGALRRATVETFGLSRIIDRYVALLSQVGRRAGGAATTYS